PHLPPFPTRRSSDLTRIDPPQPLRFVQVTTASHVSERIQNVYPVQINPGLASVEIWAYVGGRKRLDRRYKTRRMWLPRNYFQIYLKDRNWEPDRRDRVVVGEEIGGENWPESRPIEELGSVKIPPSSRR